ncbi:MAG: cell division protein FtsB [Gammaproteobacteria bacterium]|nr:cell division protein FtsB [Gammaproteobacteria bacterium]
MKKVIAILIVLLLMLQYKIWLGDGGIPKILSLQEELDLVQQQVDGLQERNQALNAEVQDLKKGLHAIEERARSELGMIGKDEIYYQVISSEADKVDNKQSPLEEAAVSP